MDDEDEKKDKVYTDDALEAMQASIEKGVAKLRPTVYKPGVAKYGEGDEEIMCVLVSDLQFGHKTPSTTIRIIHNRMDRFVKGVIRLAQLHKKMYPVKKLYVFMMGDYVQNLPPWYMNFADMEKSLFAQVYDHAIPALSGMLQAWAEEFEEVKVIAVRGNHGRQGGKMGDDDFNIDTIIHLTLEMMLAGDKRITWQHDPTTWWQKTQVFNTNILSVHGNQWKGWMNIPWYGATQRAMRWQGSLPGKDFDVMVFGHWHVPHMSDWNDVELICNGCFVSDDQFTVEQLGMASKTRQVVFGVHPRKGITFRYKVNLDK